MHTGRELRERARELQQAANESEDPRHRRKLLEEALKVAQQAEAMARRSGAMPPDFTRSSYTLYLIAGGHFADARHFTVGSDEAAMAVAYAVQDACSEFYQDFELWQGSRRVVGHVQRGDQRRPDGAAEIAAAAQQQVVEIEESLISSRRCLAESSRLLAATEQLRNRLRQDGKLA
jgi:hypothetical protein